MPTVAAIAAKTPIGANVMTYPVNLNIACAVVSSTSSSGRPFAPSAATAIPKNVEKTTSWRMSPRAIASTTDVGNRCRKMSQPCCWFCAIAAAALVSAPIGMARPAPGLNRFTSPSPRNSAIVVATSK